MSDAAVHDGRHLDHIPFPVLIGDIGGTNARFALVADTARRSSGCRPCTPPTSRPSTTPSRRRCSSRTSLMPKSAILALAGPITGERVPLTNCTWVVEPRKSVARFGLAEMILLNDFEAQSLALPGLGTRRPRPDRQRHR